MPKYRAWRRAMLGEPDVSVPPPMSARVTVVAYEVDDPAGPRRLELVARPTVTTKSIAAVAFVLSFAGAGGAVAATCDGGLAFFGAAWAVVFGPMACFFAARLFLPRRVSIANGCLRCGYSRFETLKIYGVRIASPPAFPAHDVLALVDRGGSPYDDRPVALVVQVSLDDAHAVRTMVCRVLGLRGEE